MHFIEPLEARIAPATLAGNVLSYTDLDGDLVKVTFTGETPAEADILFASGNFADATPQSLLRVDLTKNGAGLTLTATPHNGQGDSHANITLIDGTGLDLGTINVDGDLSAINAGSGDPGKVGVQSLTVLSMGRSFSSGQSLSEVKGIGSLVIKGDLVNHQFTIDGGAKSISIGGNIEETTNSVKAGLVIPTGNVGTIKIGGSIIGRSGADPNLEVDGGIVGSVTIGGSIIGGSADQAGEGDQVEFGANVGSFSLGGDLRGGEGLRSGALTIQGHVGTLKIGGSVIAGSGSETGTIETDSEEFSGAPTVVTIGGNIDGRPASQSESGEVTLRETVGALKIGGSILGGGVSDTGNLEVGGSAASISLAHNLTGGNSSGSDEVARTGRINVLGNLGNLTIGGDLSSGQLLGNGSLKLSGVVSVRGVLGSATIKGSILGNPTELVLIDAGGNHTTGAVSAIKSLTIKGSVQSASIFTGYKDYDSSFSPGNIDSGIGSVSIGGDLAGSFIVVGSSPGNDGIPGNSDDQAISTKATIGKVKVGGDFRGLQGDATHYLILGPIVKSLTVGHATFTEAEMKGSGVSFTATGTAIAESVI